MTIYEELYQYETLYTAYKKVSACMYLPVNDVDSFLINLQNHLVWRSYKPYADDHMDFIVIVAINMIARHKGVLRHDVDDETMQIINMFSLS